MPMKKPAGSARQGRAVDCVDPDDAPELIEKMLDGADIFDGNAFAGRPVQARGRGRPRTGAAREQISVRLDPDVLAKLRAAGPGWQSQINSLLRDALGIGKTRKKRAA